MLWHSGKNAYGVVEVFSSGIDFIFRFIEVSCRLWGFEIQEKIPLSHLNSKKGQGSRRTHIDKYNQT